MGVTAVAVPIREPAPQLAGSASNVVSGQASPRVATLAPSCGGKCTETDLVFASPAACVRVTATFAPWPLPAAAELTSTFGPYGSRSQPLSSYGIATCCDAPPLEVTVAERAAGPQLVALNRNAGRPIATDTERRRSGTPGRMVGRSAVLMVR